MRSAYHDIVCAQCLVSFRGDLRRKYCSRSCYNIAASRPKPEGFGAKVSRATTGKPKPWAQGERNVNYGGRATADPAIRAKMSRARRAAGSGSTEAQRQQHAERMRGPSNKMRGQQHSAATRAAVSAAKVAQYKAGTVRVRRWSISRAELEIAGYLRGRGIVFEQQYWIKGLTYRYDFYFPSLHLILEYQGDYWHANPAKYPADRVMRLGTRSMSAADIWARDATKKREAEALGYRVVCVWEHEYLADGFACVGRVLA